jgi:hypothetical protein
VRADTAVRSVKRYLAATARRKCEVPLAAANGWVR